MKRNRKSKFSTESVKAILQASIEVSNQDLAIEHKTVPSTIRRIRIGAILAHVAPEIPRRKPEELRYASARLRTTSEDKVTYILSQPIEALCEEIAKELNLCKNTVYKIRTGRMCVNIAPHLPRILSNDYHRICAKCVHYKEQYNRFTDEDGADIRKVGVCLLEIPEFTTYKHYARQCSAFMLSNE